MKLAICMGGVQGWERVQDTLGRVFYIYANTAGKAVCIKSVPQIIQSRETRHISLQTRGRDSIHGGKSIAFISYIIVFL